MIETILFWITYIIAALLLYTIIFKTYDKTKVEDKYISRYEITNNDVRHKYPLWLILLGIIIYFIPVFNIIIYAGFMCIYASECDVYFKSFLTKKY